jgi:multidrug resistance efflux pump
MDAPPKAIDDTEQPFDSGNRLTVSQPVNVGSGGRRLHPRVALPLAASIAGEDVRVLNWSVGGFAGHLGGGAVLTHGDVVTALMRLPLNGFVIEFDAPVRVVWVNGAKAGFQFLALKPDQARVLHQVLEDHLSGQARRIDQFIEISALAVGSSRGLPRAQRTLWLCATGSLLAAALCALGLFVSTAVLTTRSQVAAVVVDGFVLRSGTNGVMSGEALSPGREVTLGERLFAVATPAMIVRAAELSASLGKAELVVERHKSALDELRQMDASYKAMTSSRLDILKTKLSALRSQVDTYRNLTGREESLVPKGGAAQNTVDLRKIDMGIRDAALQDAHGDVVLAEMQSELADAGLFSAVALMKTADSEATARLRIAEAEASLGAIHARLAALNEATEIRSPCDCAIVAANARPGDTVLPGGWVYSLRPNWAKAKVAALIPPNDVSGWTVGAPVQVVVTDGWTTGRIERLSFDTQRNLVGFPDEVVKADPLLVTATIALDRDVDLALVGTPAEVVLARNPIATARAKLRTIFGQ